MARLYCRFVEWAVLGELLCFYFLSDSELTISGHSIAKRRLQSNLRIKSGSKISVFWVNGASLSAVEESYRRVAVECDILSSERLDSLFMFQVKQWLESESAGQQNAKCDAEGPRSAGFRKSSSRSRRLHTC